MNKIKNFLIALVLSISLFGGSVFAIGSSGVNDQNTWCYNALGELTPCTGADVSIGTLKVSTVTLSGDLSLVGNTLFLDADGDSNIECSSDDICNWWIGTSKHTTLDNNGVYFHHASGIFLEDDSPIKAGGTQGSPDAKVSWATTDVNANILLTTLPEGDATNVPCSLVGDRTADSLDLGLFDGLTSPCIGALSDDATKTTYMYHDGSNGQLKTNSGAINITSAGVNIGTGPLAIGTTPVAGTSLILPLENDAVTPTLAFGDGDTGIYESSDDALTFTHAGVARFVSGAGFFRSSLSTGGALVNEVTSNTNPTLLPNRSDQTTGIGSGGIGELSLIANATEMGNFDGTTGDQSINFTTMIADPVATATMGSYDAGITTTGNNAQVIAGWGTTLSHLNNFDLTGTNTVYVESFSNDGTGTVSVVNNNNADISNEAGGTIDNIHSYTNSINNTGSTIGKYSFLKANNQYAGNAPTDSYLLEWTSNYETLQSLHGTNDSGATDKYIPYSNLINGASDTQVLVAVTALTATHKIMRIDSGAGGAVTMVATPTINDPIHDGECIKIQGDDDTNTITFQDESNLANSGLQLEGGIDFTFGKGNMLEVCYDSGDDNWYEVSRSDN